MDKELQFFLIDEILIHMPVTLSCILASFQPRFHREAEN